MDKVALNSALYVSNFVWHLKNTRANTDNHTEAYVRITCAIVPIFLNVICRSKCLQIKHSMYANLDKCDTEIRNNCLYYITGVNLIVPTVLCPLYSRYHCCIFCLNRVDYFLRTFYFALKVT